MKHDVDYLKDESYRLIGAAFEVYNDRGFGLSEEIYQECIEIELELRTIPFRAKQELACFYKGRELKKRFIPDLIAPAATRNSPGRCRPTSGTPSP
jgi:GxxExxY protein